MADEESAYQRNESNELSGDQTTGPHAEGYFFEGDGTTSEAQEGMSVAPSNAVDPVETTSSGKKSK